MRFFIFRASVATNAEPAGQRRERGTLQDQRDEDDAEGDEDDLLARRKWCTRRSCQWQGKGDDERITAAYSSPTNEEDPAPGWELGSAAAQPGTDLPADVRAGTDPRDADNDHA